MAGMWTGVSGQRYGQGTDYSARELGYPPPPLPPPGNLPPGGGGESLPRFLAFSSLVQTASRTFLWSFDEALKDNPSNALAMARDPILWKALRARQRPTAQLKWKLEPLDDTDPAEVEAGKLVTEIIEAIPHFQRLKMYLLNALWYGKYGVLVRYKWDSWRGRQVMVVDSHAPVNGDKIRVRWSGQIGVLVNYSYPGSREPVDYGLAHFLTRKEREQFIFHQHEPDDPDWVEGDMAGALYGVGLRGRLYWFWWLKQQVFGLLMNWVERFSNGFTIFYYDAHNPNAEAQARAAAEAQFTNSALLYPRWLMGNTSPNGVDRLEVGTASPSLLDKLTTDYFDNVMSQAIVGQTLSSDHTGSGGLGGGGVARFQSETLDEIIAYDALDLEGTLQTDLVNVLYRYNAPGVRPGRFTFDVESPDAQALLGYAQVLYEMGMELDGDQLYDLAQMTKPKPGGSVISKIGAMQAAAVLQSPQGVPMAGQAGPSGSPPPEDVSQAGPQEVGEPAMDYRRNGAIRRNPPKAAVGSGRECIVPKRKLVRA